MERVSHEVREWYRVRGHDICVFTRDRDQFGVTVDGMEFAPLFSSSHAAWAAGVAESYRRGPTQHPRRDPG